MTQCLKIEWNTEKYTGFAFFYPKGKEREQNQHKRADERG